MDWGFIASIVLSIGFGATTIFLAFKLAKRRKPVWASHTAKLIGLGAGAPSEIKLYFGNNPVSEVYQTALIFFNSGNETIIRDNVTEKVTIHFKGSEILRQPNVNRTSKDAIKFSAKQVVKDGDNCIELDFLYLDHNDGAVVDVLHTESKDIRCSGNIIGTKRIVNIGHFSQSHPPRYFRGVLGAFRLLIALAMTLTGFAIILYGAFTSSLTEFALTRLYIPLMFILAGLTFIPDIRAYFHYRRFPEWSIAR